MDVESIDAGQMDTIIFNQIAARPYFLVVLAPGSLDRCNQPGDWLRAEIEHAMDYDRIIIPLITSNFSFNDVLPLLTGKLEKLHRYQALNIPHDYFEAAMERLRTRYLKPVNLPVKQTPKSEQAVVQNIIDQVAALPLVTQLHLTAQEYFEQALASYLCNDKSAAIESYRKAVFLNPQFAEAYCGLGMAYRDSGEVFGAVESFSVALELQPDHPLAGDMRKYITAQRGRFWATRKGS
jgi:tetratricopeptide (TPR) repeat protein